MDQLLIFTILSSFVVTILLVPHWIHRAKKEKLIGRDIHKLDKKEVAEGGGINVLAGIGIGILLYVGVKTFFMGGNGQTKEIFAILSVILIASMVGLVDDALGWKKGLAKKIRILVLFFAAIPLMVINAGTSSMALPFFGTIDFGIWYALILIPLGVIGVTTTFNFLGGFNGLETGQGIILLSGLAYVTYITNQRWLSVIALCGVSALFGFWFFNKYPAKIFPGDVLTYSVGALFAAITILGNVEKIAIFFFIPYIFEVILKSRGRLNKESFGKLNNDGSLDMPYKKSYSLTHVAIKVLKKIKPSKKVYEKDVTWLINFVQLVVVVVGILVFL